MLQYITSTDCGRSVPDQVRAVIAGGCRWITVRMPDASDEEIEKVINEIMPLCIEKESFLLLDRRVELAKKVNVGGVNLGKGEMTPSQARMILGPAAVVGLEVDSMDAIEAVRALDIDYLAIGPFRRDAHDDKDALDTERIKAICHKKHEKEIDIAHVAYGDINKDDVKGLLAAGCDGIAVSDAIAKADDMESATREFVAMMPIGE